MPAARDFQQPQAGPVPAWAVPGLVAAAFMAAQAAPAGVLGGTTSNAIGSRPPAVVTLTVRRGMVVNQSAAPLRWAGHPVLR